MSSPLDDTLILRLAELARLHLSDAEVAEHREQLARILDYVEVLRGAAANDAVSGAPELSESPAHRADTVSESLDADIALRGSAARIDDFFRVPRVLDSGA